MRTDTRKEIVSFYIPKKVEGPQKSSRKSQWLQKKIKRSRKWLTLGEVRSRSHAARGFFASDEEATVALVDQVHRGAGRAKGFNKGRFLFFEFKPQTKLRNLDQDSCFVNIHSKVWNRVATVIFIPRKVFSIRFSKFELASTPHFNYFGDFFWAPSKWVDLSAAAYIIRSLRPSLTISYFCKPHHIAPSSSSLITVSRVPLKTHPKKGPPQIMHEIL